jgi:SAM-dependent methyltransferase
MPAAQHTNFSISGFFRDKLAVAKGAWETFLRDWAERGKEAIPARIDTPWQRYWGEPYGLDLKQWLLKPVFEEMESTGRAGDLIVDVGSGARPVTQFLKARTGRKRILVDVAAENGHSGDEQKIRLNVEKAGEPGALSFRKAMVRVCRFLEIAAGTEANHNMADTIVFSDLLNYVDFRKVLGGFTNFLKPGGRLVIVNLPMRGNQSLFSEKGLKDNGQLYGFLEEHRFEIEHKAFPCRPRDETEEAGELIVLVARKCA